MGSMTMGGTISLGGDSSITINGLRISVRGNLIYVNGKLYGPVNMTPEEKAAFDTANAPMKGEDVTSGMTVRDVVGNITLGPGSTLKVEGSVQGDVSATDVKVSGSVTGGVTAAGDVKVGGSVLGGVRGKAIKAGGSIMGGARYEQ